jgi:Rhodopirellula transposase DDE domain
MGVNAELVGLMLPELRLLFPEVDEKARRLMLGAVARAAGDGGVAAVAKATGASWQTVADGAAELESGQVAAPGRVRRPGAGRKKLAEADPGLVPALLALVEDSVRGDPGSPLTWTIWSTQKLAGELTAQGHRCSPQTAWRLLHEQGFSTQGNARVLEGKRHPDRDGQFRYIAALAREHLAAGQPVISVDAKKKELVGEYGQDGKVWRRQGDPAQVRSHDFEDGDAGHAIPYGIYDVGANTGFVNVGTDHNTAAFAVESVSRWWAMTGRDAYPDATRLLICCDAGGNNGWQNRAWKAGLAALAQETGLEITVCHFPPGTSKWNKIEHRLFSQITLNWRGRPLTSHDVIIASIGAVTTSTGLTVTAVLDRNPYPTGVKISDEQFRELQDRALTRHRFHGEWNYTLLPAWRPAPPPEPAPPAPGPDAATLDALARPEITGISRQDLAALAAALEIPWAAAREERLYTARRGPRRKNSGAPARLTLPAIVLAAICRYRLGMTCDTIAALLGIDPSCISRDTRRAAALLTAAGHPVTPGPARLRTLHDLHQHAAAAGLTIPAPPPQHTPRQQNTLTAPATPQTHLILERLHMTGYSPRSGAVAADAIRMWLPMPARRPGYTPGINRLKTDASAYHWKVHDRAAVR